MSEDINKEEYIAPELVKEVGESGKFLRQKNRFTTPFGNNDEELPVEAGRYRLL